MRNLPHPYLLTFILGCTLSAAPVRADTTVPDTPLRLSFAPALNGYSSVSAPDSSERRTVPAVRSIVVPTAEPRPATAEPAPALTENGLQIQEVTAPLSLPRTIDLTTSPNDLWERIRNGFAMPTLSNDLVEQHQSWYLSRPDNLRRMVEHSRRYLHYIVEEVERRGMPTELAFLPMVEQ